MSEWKQFLWGDIATLEYGRALRGYQEATGPVRVFGTNGPVGWTSESQSDGPGVIIGRKGAYRGVHYSEGPFWVIDTAYYLKPKCELDLRWAYYALKNQDINSMDSGSAIPSTSRADFYALSVKLPPLSRQRAIAAVLGALDDKIAANERIVTTCDGLAQAYMACAVADTERVRLADLASITMGSSPPGETYNEAGIGLPFYQGTRDFGVRFPTRRVWCSEPVRVASPGSILVSVRAPVGRLNVTAEECCIGRGLAALVSKYGTPSVLYHSLRTTPKIWQPFESEGTVFGAINKRQLEDLSVPAFDAATAMRLEELLSSLDEYVRRAFQENLALIQLRDTLLPGLMSGAIRVRDAERIAEDVT